MMNDVQAPCAHRLHKGKLSYNGIEDHTWRSVRQQLVLGLKLEPGIGVLMKGTPAC
jgi:hypothetical protein